MNLRTAEVGDPFLAAFEGAKGMDKENESDECSTDEYNRRKRYREEKEVFDRSKRINRTPTKGVRNMDEKMDVLLKEIREMRVHTEQVREINNEVKQMRVEMKEYREEVRQLKKENANLKEECNKVDIENKELKKEMGKLKSSMEIMEKRSKENNVIITGILIDTTEGILLEQSMSNFFRQHLELNIKPKRAIKLGPKICLVELNTEQEKRDIMQNKRKLRNIKEEKIFINEDLTRAEREMKKEIKARAQEEMAKGKEVKMGFKKVIIDGQEWRWSKEESKLVAKN